LRSRSLAGSISRREVLGILLGAPLATEACRYLPRRTIDGTIRGASMSIGHRLRAGADSTVERAATSDSSARRVRVAIVGAGPSGLSAGWWLDRHGENDYAVFELEPVAGGSSTYGTDGVVPYPCGAHYIPLPTADNPHLVTLLDEMGQLEPRGAGAASDSRIRGIETALIREPEERLFIGGAWRAGLFPTHGASAEDLAELARFSQEMDGWVDRRDGKGRRAFTVPLRRCSDDAEFTALDRISAARYLERQGYRSARLRWYVEYACRDDYGAALEDTSAWAMIFYFAARVPAKGAPSAPFLTWPEGNGRLVSHLSRSAGSRLLTGRMVTDIVPRDDAVELAVFDVKAQRLERYLADRVIVAAPKFVAARVVRPFREHAPAHFADFTYGAWMVANLHLRARPASVGFPFAWDNVLHDSPSLGYVVATHQALRDSGPTVWTYYQPFIDHDPRAGRERLAAADHAGFCDAILGDLGRAHAGLEDCVERIDVWRWGHAMIRPRPGFIWGPGRRRAAEALGRVHFAHSDLSGLALFEEAFDQGIRAAEEVRAARG
jgi:protoporphyrinogen oxidase